MQLRCRPGKHGGGSRERTDDPHWMRSLKQAGQSEKWLRSALKGQWFEEDQRVRHAQSTLKETILKPEIIHSHRIAVSSHRIAALWICFFFF